MLPKLLDGIATIMPQLFVPPTEKPWMCRHCDDDGSAIFQSRVSMSQDQCGIFHVLKYVQQNDGSQ